MLGMRDDVVTDPKDAPAVPDALQRAAEAAAVEALVFSHRAWLTESRLASFIIRHVLAAKVCTEPEHDKLIPALEDQLGEATANWHDALVAKSAAEQAIRDIDAHATPVGSGEVPEYYAVSVGSLHRALGLTGAAAKCRDLSCERAEAAEQALAAAQARLREVEASLEAVENIRDEYRLRADSKERLIAGYREQAREAEAARDAALQRAEEWHARVLEVEQRHYSALVARDAAEAERDRLRAAVVFLVGGEPTWECQHGTPIGEFCSKACSANVVREALALLREARRG